MTFLPQSGKQVREITLNRHADMPVLWLQALDRSIFAVGILKEIN